MFCYSKCRFLSEYFSLQRSSPPPSFLVLLDRVTKSKPTRIEITLSISTLSSTIGTWQYGASSKKVHRHNYVFTTSSACESISLHRPQCLDVPFAKKKEKKTFLHFFLLQHSRVWNHLVQLT